MTNFLTNHTWSYRRHYILYEPVQLYVSLFLDGVGEHLSIRVSLATYMQQLQPDGSFSCLRSNRSYCADADRNTGVAKAWWEGHIHAFVSHGAKLDKQHKHGWTAFRHTHRARHRTCLLTILTHDVNLLDMYC